MKIVFEDHGDKLKSRLIKAAYPEDIVQNSFIFAEGNGNLKRVVNSLLESTQDNIYVYIDMVPGNDKLVTLYNKLRTIALKNPRVNILPVVCAEHYLIRSLANLGLLDESDMVDVCLNCKPYFDIFPDKEECNSFERYCKEVVRVLGRICLFEQTEKHPDYGYYADVDCKCSRCDIMCRANVKALDKAIDFVRQLPYYPVGLLNTKVNGTADNKTAHKDLVDRYNAMMQLFKENDPDSNRRYLKIEYAVI